MRAAGWLVVVFAVALAGCSGTKESLERGDIKIKDGAAWRVFKF